MIRYLMTTYKPGGRGPSEYDCWGLSRDIRHDVYDRPMMAEYADVTPKRMTHNMDKVIDSEKLSLIDNPEDGAIACAWAGRVCVHVGVVVIADGRAWVIETQESTGPVMTPLATFEQRYSRVEYYD